MEEVNMTAWVTLTLLPKPKENRSTHLATDFNLVVPPNVDEKQYLDSDGIVNKIGSHVVTQCFVQGLIANIHMAHGQGFRNDAEHLRYIIQELENGFVRLADVYKRT